MPGTLTSITVSCYIKEVGENGLGRKYLHLSYKARNIFKMKSLLLLGLVAVASAQYYQQRPYQNLYWTGPQFYTRPQYGSQYTTQYGYGNQYGNKYGNQYGIQYGNQNSGGGSDADGSHGASLYHYSWQHDGDREYNQNSAVAYCTNLGNGWVPVAIETQSESNFIDNVISSHRKKFIWTGGVRSGFGWRWLSGGSFRDLNWSHTGGNGVPQPDNREGGENCLAVLNNVYRDGIKWHDIACHHTKPVICERNLY